MPYAPLTARTTDRGEATRRHILEAAATAFARKGYAGASLNDLIRESGVTKGGFYFHFASKEELALTIMREKQEVWAGTVMAAALRHTAAFDQLTAMPAAVIDLYEADPSARCMHRLSLELAEDPRLAPEVSNLFKVWVDLTSSVMRKAQREGSMRTDVDAEAAAEVAVAAFIGLETISAVVSDLADLRERLERFASFYLSALRPAGPTASKKTDRSV